jgi:hypothetical protein
MASIGRDSRTWNHFFCESFKFSLVVYEQDHVNFSNYSVKIIQ